MTDKNKIHSIKVSEIDSTVKVEFNCPNCNEGFVSEYNDYDRGDVFDRWTENITCDCGAVLGCEFEIQVDTNITYTPPKEVLENLPAPNQIDLFTNKTVEEMKSTVE